VVYDVVWQAAIRNTDQVTDTAVFLSAVNKLIPPLPRAQGESAITAAFRERYKSVRSEVRLTFGRGCCGADVQAGANVGTSLRGRYVCDAVHGLPGDGFRDR